ncbi:unnamed protein product [Rotaria sp. Silwood2]|nr:unnamed protein product [Rotaria sp. Silwood2]CAF4306601.1 unnamed protein product [Rotaria sp. Silwood2]CAF4340627.1 unnamed protein product [Rotaria sp. Silwood2]
MTVAIITVLLSFSIFAIDLTVLKLLEILELQGKRIHLPLYSNAITAFINPEEIQKTSRRHWKQKAILLHE